MCIRDSNTSAIRDPALVHVPERVTHLSMGEYYKLCVTETGSVFGWGNSSLGVLGIGSLTRADDMFGSSAAVESPRRLAQFGPGTEYLASQVVATATSSYCVTVCGNVFAWGSSQCGQLGLGQAHHGALPDHFMPVRSSDIMSQPARLDPDSFKSPVVQVAAGANHVLAVTVDGTVFVWGSNQSGQLGLADTVDRWSPELLDRGWEATHVAAGAAHSSCVTRDGALFCWGSGKWGQLGLGTNEDASEPTRVGGIKGTAVQAYAGGDHTHCLTAEGAVYSWGTMKFFKFWMGQGEQDTLTQPQVVWEAI
eukprot:TRINITY_DN7982_c0_g1_i2.p1 TRINITY_DN7982_c0_g1~~TRINITY_DN7982_c0_g1_i2.p1  ORF type:complete len:349 (-),score=51.62 TRINITY_DN7982_c0_g1_i2:82-1005(-)